MAILSFSNSERLFWLGRYTERVFTEIRFVSVLPSWAWDEAASASCFGEGNPESIYSSMVRAYDNAIVLRDEIGSDTFSYIQLALYEMSKAKKSLTPLVGLQKVSDNIAAFWGMADDSIHDEHVRGIIKLGKRVERVDLYARHNVDPEDIRREIQRLTYRVEKAGLKYDESSLSALNELAGAGEMDFSGIVREVEGLIVLS
mgnify:CR=1 FL=1